MFNVIKTFILLFTYLSLTNALTNNTWQNNSATLKWQHVSATPSLMTWASTKSMNNSYRWNSNSSNNSHILPSSARWFMTSTVSPQSDKCFGKERWKQDVFTDGKECLTNECMETYFDEITLYMDCNSREVADELQLIGSRANEYALLVAEDDVNAIRIETALDKVKNFKKKSKKYFTIHYGFIVKSFQPAHIPLQFNLNTGAKVKVLYPPGQLENENTAFVFTQFDSVYSLYGEIKYFHTRTAIDSASLNLRSSRFVSDKKFYNSKIISFLTSPVKRRPGDYISITFQLNNYGNLTLTNHICVHIQSLGAGFWTDSECHEHFVDKVEIICRCRALTGSYAVISEQEKEVQEEAGIKRTMISALIIGVSVGGIVLMVFSMLFPYLMKTAHLGGMLIIYRLSDLTVAVECFVLMYGVIKSDDVKRTPLIGATLHYFQASVMVWTITEGFFLYHGILPLFQNTTGLRFFFSTVAFGFAAAVTGGAIGYPFGYTDKKEFIWPTSSSSDTIYLMVPSLACLLVLVVFDVVLIYELLSWIGNKDDYSYARSVKFLKRANGYMFVFIVTNFFGVSSQRSIADGFYTYGFIAFFAIQIMCLFYHHCLSNFEIWSYREEEDELKNVAEENEEAIETTDVKKNEKKNIEDLLLAAPIIEENLPAKHLMDEGVDNLAYDEDDLDGRDALDGHNSPSSSTTGSQVALIKSRPASANSESVYGSRETLKSQARPNDTIVDIPEDSEKNNNDTVGVHNNTEENLEQDESVVSNDSSSDMTTAEEENGNKKTIENTENEVNNDDDIAQENNKNNEQQNTDENNENVENQVATE